MAFEIPGVFTQANQLKSSGPVRQSHKFHRELGQHMIYFEAEVSNGFKLPTTLPFGVFAEVVNRANTHQSTLEVWVANGYYSNNPTFHEARTNVTNVNKYICKGHTIEQVVRANAFCLEGSTIWESSLAPIDEVHSMRTTTYIDELNQITRGEYDANLGLHQTITEDLVHVTAAEADANYPTGTLSSGGGVFRSIEFNEIKCGWFLKVAETMNEGSASTTYGTKNHAFPPVLQWGPNTQILYGVNKDGETYQTSALSDSRLKEAYSGPCKVQVTKVWSSSRPLSAAQQPTQMLTDSFVYDGIFFKHSLPSCLHFNILLHENTGQHHPVLKDGQFRWATYPATTYTEWPNIVLPQLPVPYKGGFLTTTETIYAP